MMNLILFLYCISPHCHASERPALGSADWVVTVKLIAGWLILSDDLSLSSLTQSHTPSHFSMPGRDQIENRGIVFTPIFSIICRSSPL